MGDYWSAFIHENRGKILYEWTLPQILEHFFDYLVERGVIKKV